METLMLASTVIDFVAVLALGWLVLRTSRASDAALGEQRAALEALRTDLGELLAEAERRARALEDSLGVREKSLRSLLTDVGRVEARQRAATRLTVASPAAAGDTRTVEGGRRLGVDPAEARLLRDLEVSLPPRRA